MFSSQNWHLSLPWIWYGKSILKTSPFGMSPTCLWKIAALHSSSCDIVIVRWTDWGRLCLFFNLADRRFFLARGIPVVCVCVCVCVCVLLSVCMSVFTHPSERGFFLPRQRFGPKSSGCCRCSKCKLGRHLAACTHRQQSRQTDSSPSSRHRYGSHPFCLD
jgi:hypothetical protein